MVKRKVSLNEGPAPGRAGVTGAVAPTAEVLDYFFNTGIVYHEVELPSPLPDVISSFKIVRSEGPEGNRVRAAEPGEDPDVEIAPLEHLAQLSNRWLPFPYQLSCLHAVQLFLQPSGGDGRSVRALLAVDTMEVTGCGGRHLDAALDAGRPFRPLAAGELGAFLDHPETRELLLSLEKGGVDRAPFKFAALLALLAPHLPRLRLSSLHDHTPIDVSLIVDLGNSRSNAVLAESRDGEMLAVPLQVRDGSNPFRLSEENFGSRITFLPSPFEGVGQRVATGHSFATPSVSRMGREALDRALETPHRYMCSLSGPKRYLWDARPTEERWFFATQQHGEYVPVHGRLFKYVQEGSGGLALREDGPSTPADPRYAPRTMMLFAMVEVLSQALSQINSVTYRTFQGKEGSPRVLRHLVITYPSGMRHEERAVYEALVRNAVLLTCHLLNIRPEHRPNFNPQTGDFNPFLVIDEALAAQMVYVYQEAVHVFGGSMEELIAVYGGKDNKLRVASVDIGGGTTDLMVAEYEDKLQGTGTALAIKKLFQDGVSIAGDDVCRAIVEDILFDQMLQQLPTVAERMQLVQLFSEGGSDHGAAWRTLKAKLVPYFWLPLSRCYWALAEGATLPDHHSEKLYSATELFQAFQMTEGSSQVLQEADDFIASMVPRFPGLKNLFFRLDPQEVVASIDRVLREPLRRYADLLAQLDIDVLVLAGRTSALQRVRELFVSEMPVPPPRIKTMSSYRVADWYPAKWRRNGHIKDPKSTVTAGAMVLHLAGRNRLPGLLIESLTELTQRPIYGLYQDAEPHIGRANELFRKEKTSPPFAYTGGMIIGFRNVDSQEMDGSPLFEVRPTTGDVETALLEDRVSLRFRLGDQERIEIVEVKSQRGAFTFEPTDFRLSLRTAVAERYWLDTGSFRPSAQLVDEEEDESTEAAS